MKLRSIHAICPHTCLERAWQAKGNPAREQSRRTWSTGGRGSVPVKYLTLVDRASTAYNRHSTHRLSLTQSASHVDFSRVNTYSSWPPASVIDRLSAGTK